MIAEVMIGFAIGGSGGGFVGYLLRGWLDDRREVRREGRRFTQTDLQQLRDDLYTFLGVPQSHFLWLMDAGDRIWKSDSTDEKVQLIADWVYSNSMRYPRERRGPMNLIMNVAYQLGRGDRHFLDDNPNGEEIVTEAWQTLDDYAQDLTSMLRGKE